MHKGNNRAKLFKRLKSGEHPPKGKIKMAVAMQKMQDILFSGAECGYSAKGIKKRDPGAYNYLMVQESNKAGLCNILSNYVICLK